MLLSTGCDSVLESAPSPRTAAEVRDRDDTERPNPPNDSPPWASGSGPTTTVSGRVVTPDRTAIEGAEVQLIYPGDPHEPEGVAYSGRTDGDGHFRFEDISAYVTFPIVVRHAGATRSFWPPSAGPEITERNPVEIRIAPTRPVHVSMQCTLPGRLPASTFDERIINLRVHWLSGTDSPDTDEIVSTTMLAIDGTPDPLNARGDPGWSRVIPGWSPYLPPVPADAHSFERDLALPIGNHRLTIYGSCGTATHDFAVPADGPVPPVAIEMPAPNHSSLRVALSSRSRRSRVFPEIYLGETRIEYSSELTRENPIRLRHLAPGDYEIRNVTCHEPIRLPSSTPTQVTIGNGECEVRR